MSKLNWWTSAQGTETIDIRDDGQDEVAAVLQEDKTLKIDSKTGAPVQAYEKARNAWPKGVAVVVKSTITGGDWNKIQRMLDDNNTSDNPIIPAMIYVAVLLRGFKDSDGKLIEVPDSIDDRIALLEDEPIQIVIYVNDRIAQLISDPLPGTEPLESKRDSSTGASTARRSTQRSTASTHTSAATG